MTRWLLAVVFVAPRPFCNPRVPVGPAPAVVAQEPAAVRVDPDPASSNVYLAAVIRAGSAYDPLDKPGLASLTVHGMVEAGAGDRTADALAEALYPLGTAFEVVVGKELASIRLTCHRDAADACVDLFADALTAPRFDPTTMTRLAGEAVYAVTDALVADEEALGREVLEARLFHAHPYGTPVPGRASVIPLLTPDDVRRFYDAHVVRQAVTIGVAGAVDEALVASLRDRLDALPGRVPPPLVLQSPVPVEGRRLFVVGTDTPVTGFWFGHPHEVDRSHEDWPALYLATVALGAHRQSHGRLFRAIRGTRGLNYGDYAYMEAYRQRGGAPVPEQGVVRSQPHFAVWIRPTDLDNGPFALKLAIHEVERWVEEGLTAEEFEATRSYIVGRLALEAPDPGRRLLVHLDADVAGGLDLLDDLPTRLNALTLEDVNAAIRRHIHPDDLEIVAVTGAPDALVAALTEEPTTPIVYGAVTPTDAQAELDAMVAAIDLRIAPEAVAIVPAEGRFR